MIQMFRRESKPQGLTQIGHTVTASGIYTDYVSDSGLAFVHIESNGESSWWRVESASLVAA